MSMITGCPACGTMFRVVPDQLRISEGWVRCGHCGEVFDATGSLQPDVRPAEAPPPAVEPGAMEPDASQAQAVPAATQDVPAPGQQDSAHGEEAPVAGEPAQPLPDAPEPQPDSEPEPEPAPEPALHPPVTPASPWPPAAAMGTEAAAGASSSSWDSQPPAASSRFDYSQAFREKDETDPSEPEGPDSVPPDSTLEDVSFVRQARRQALWRRPLVRFALLLVVLALAGLLAVQFAVRERDRLAATQPQLRPLLEQLCDRLGCAIAAPRRIESIVIDNSGFTRLRPDVYRLSFTLKNPSPLPVAVPALQLTLTDTQEQPVVQRVIMPAELVAAPATIAAASDWSASVALAVSPDSGAAARIAGYRLLAFYP